MVSNSSGVKIYVSGYLLQQDKKVPIVQKNKTYQKNGRQIQWGRSEPFQGSWAYLGPHGVNPRAIAQF